MAEEKKNQITLDWDEDPIERLAKESQALSQDDWMGIAIAAYLGSEFKKDPNLAESYRQRKVTLKAIIDFVISEAKKKLGNKNGQIPDAEVYGWAVHFVQDGKISKAQPDALTITITREDREAAHQAALKKLQEEELEKLRKKEAAKKAAEKKRFEEQERKRRESGQMSLFDYDDWPDVGGGDA